ncbi:hypothetical protein [Paradevosia shaoguanensis]|uniref:hypothetical protein n=1 Tax=Paradevosia shaoguanensis TaxID=1335043 RepID=UPI003C744732
MAKFAHTTVAPRFDNRAIMKAAWAGYHKTAAQMRETAFSPERFRFELKLAWCNGRREAEQQALEAAPAAPLEAQQEDRHIAEIRNELLWIEMAERIDWQHHRELSVELFQARA